MFFKMKASHSSNVQDNYILHLAQQNGLSKDTKVAATVSGTNQINICNSELQMCVEGLKGHSDTITDICFDMKRSNILWSTSLDGTLRSWDIEQSKDNSSSVISRQSVGYTSLGLSCDGSILVVGTEQNKDTLNVLVEVWDIRKLEERSPKKLATFEEIHSDDITKIRFHPANPKVVAIGSTDGLVTVLDLTTYDEEDCLTQSLNTESSVRSFGMFGPSYEFLYILTHVETLQIWNYEQGDLLANMGIRSKVERPYGIDYIIDCVYHDATQRLFVIGGDQRGDVVLCHVNLDKVEVFHKLTSHTSIVRCALFTNNHLITGGEDGRLVAWKAINSKQ